MWTATEWTAWRLGFQPELGRLWFELLHSTPSLPEPAAQAARAQASARYDNFVAALGRRLNQGPKLRQEIPEDVAEKQTGN